MIAFLIEVFEKNNSKFFECAKKHSKYAECKYLNLVYCFRFNRWLERHCTGRSCKKSGRNDSTRTW